MGSSSRFGSLTLVVSLALSFAAPVRGQEAASEGAALNMAEMKFVTVPGLPTCATGSVQKGDPTKGSSFILSKLAAGCSIPWHWHTPNEHLMLVSGTATAQMKDGKPVALRAGAFALMPSHHVHQFSCSGACVLYVYSDAAFDIHYVDGKGSDISPDEALKAVKETAAMEMK